MAKKDKTQSSDPKTQNYLIVGELCVMALEKAKANPLWSELTESVCPLDYALVQGSSSQPNDAVSGETKAAVLSGLTIHGAASHGSCEGIVGWLDVSLDGTSSYPIILKTLNTD